MDIATPTDQNCLAERAFAAHPEEKKGRTLRRSGKGFAGFTNGNSIAADCFSWPRQTRVTVRRSS